MVTKPQPPRIHLPKGWQNGVKSAVIHAIALAHCAIVYARVWAADSINARVRLAAENDRLHEDCALLREELRINNSRMTQIVHSSHPEVSPGMYVSIRAAKNANQYQLVSAYKRQDWKAKIRWTKRPCNRSTGASWCVVSLTLGIICGSQDQCFARQHLLYFLPLPQGQGSFRPTFLVAPRKEACRRGRSFLPSPPSSSL